jgi:hypothetical protein
LFLVSFLIQDCIMSISRRGFLAGLLALLPFAKTAQAGRTPKSTIRIFNGNGTAGFGIVAPSITSTAQYLPINSGTGLSFTGVPGTATAVSCLRFEDGTIVPAIVTQYPLPGQTKTFSFFQVTDPNTALTTTVLVQV